MIMLEASLLPVSVITAVHSPVRHDTFSAIATFRILPHNNQEQDFFIYDKTKHVS
jgi:hypothetical protein